MKKSKRKYSLLLSFGHFCADVNAGCLAALLPFLISAYHYDYATATSLVMVSNLVGSLVQVIFGGMADRKERPMTMLAGVLLSGAGMAVMGVLHNFFGMCVAVIVSGLGIAMFHPQAMKVLNRFSAEGEAGSDVSIFSFGGSLGVTMGPIMVNLCVGLFGLQGTLLFLVPGVCCIVLYLTSGKALLVPEKAPGTVAVTKLSVQPASAEKEQWAAFWILCVVVFGRSIVVGSLNTFVSLYWIDFLGQSETVGNQMLSLFYGLTALLTLAGGSLADRFGYEKMIRLSLLLLPPSVFLMLVTKNLLAAFVLLLPLAAGGSLSYSPIVVLGQKYLPQHTGFASAVTLGLSSSVGGIVTPFLGKAADLKGMETALCALGMLAVIPWIASLFLKNKKGASH